MNLTPKEFITALNALVNPPFEAETGNAYVGILGSFISEYEDEAFKFLKSLKPGNTHRMFIRALTENK